jgi:3-methyl-2-oxobutanoate hydroxymethyltransferase
MSPDSPPRSVLDLTAMKAAGRKIVMLTCYDATFARLIAPLVDVLLVGDSVNQVVAGHETTLSATLDQLIYHARAVRRGAPDALLLVDLPFLS